MRGRGRKRRRRRRAVEGGVPMGRGAEGGSREGRTGYLMCKSSSFARLFSSRTRKKRKNVAFSDVVSAREDGHRSQRRRCYRTKGCMSRPKMLTHPPSSPLRLAALSLLPTPLSQFWSISTSSAECTQPSSDSPRPPHTSAKLSPETAWFAYSAPNLPLSLTLCFVQSTKVEQTRATGPKELQTPGLVFLTGASRFSSRRGIFGG